ATDNNNRIVKYSKLSSNGTIGTAQSFVRGMQVSSAPFVYNNRRYIWLASQWGVAGPSPTVAGTPPISYFLFEDSSLDGTTYRIAARALYGTGRNSTVTSGIRVPSIITDGSGFPSTLALDQFTLSLTSGTNTSPVGISRLTAQPNASVPLTRANF